MRAPESTIPQHVQRLSIGMHCGDCHVAVDIAPRDLLDAWLAGRAVHCPSCGSTYDVWRRMIDQLTFGAFGTRYAAVGASVVTAEFEFRRNQPLLLDLQTLGIPAAAVIEEIVLTPDGSEDGFLNPVFLKDPLPGQTATDMPVIYPIPVGAGAEQTRVSALIVWTSQPASSDPVREALFAGVRAAHRSDKLGAIVSSNVAMELALGLAMDRWLGAYGIGRERRGRFLDSDATYGAQLSVLLSVAAAAEGLTPIPERAAAALSRLRKLRNRVAHGQLQPANISEAEVAECLAGAAAGVVYCEKLRTALSRTGHE